MPILAIQCPQCGHRFQGLVLEGTRHPQEWVCSKCGSREAEVDRSQKPLLHPWEKEGGHGIGLCPCCS